MKAHRVVPIAVIAFLGIFGCLFRPLTNWLTSPLQTSFLVQGDTSSVTFTALEQDESQNQAGLFASSEKYVDVQISCSTLRRVDSSQSNLPCTRGFLQLSHVIIEALRLGRDTRIDLRVADKNLYATLVATTGDDPLITFVLDGSSKVSDGGSVTRSGFIGEWSAGTDDHSFQLTILKPEFDSGSNEGGQTLKPGSSIAFQRNGQSAFIDDKAALSVAATVGEIVEPLNNKLLQISELNSGKMVTISPLKTPDGALSGLHVVVTGTSNQINLVSPMTDVPNNQAINQIEKRTRNRITSAAVLSTILLTLVSIGTSVFTAVVSTHYTNFIQKREPSPANTVAPHRRTRKKVETP